MGHSVRAGWPVFVVGLGYAQKSSTSVRFVPGKNLFVLDGYITQLVLPISDVLPTHVVRGRKNPLHLKLPERLRRARKKTTLSASALSLVAGISQGGVAKLEAGTWVPRLPTVERLAIALRISPSWLAFGLELAWKPGTSPGCSGLAQRARDARAVRGFSIREVERRAETAEGAVRAIEGGTMPGLDTLEQIANALGVSPAWLAYGEGPMDAQTRRRATQAGQTHANE